MKKYTENVRRPNPTYDPAAETVEEMLARVITNVEYIIDAERGLTIKSIRMGGGHETFYAHTSEETLRFCGDISHLELHNGMYLTELRYWPSHEGYCRP